MDKIMDTSVIKLKNGKCIFCGMKIKNGEYYVFSKIANGYAHKKCSALNSQTDTVKEKIVKTKRETREITGKNLKKARIMSERHKGSGNPFYGKRHSLETKKIISEKSKLQKGRKHSEETKRKLSEAHKGKKLSEERLSRLTNSRIGRFWFTNGDSNLMAYKCPEGFWKGRTLKTKSEEIDMAKIEKFQRDKLVEVRTCFGRKSIPEKLEFVDGPNCYFCNEAVGAEENQQFTIVVPKKYVCAHAGCAKIYKSIREGKRDKSWFFPVKCTTLKITFDNVLIAAAYLRKNGITAKHLIAVCDMICKCCRGDYESIYKLKWAYVNKRRNITKPENWESKKPVSTMKKTAGKAKK